MIRRERNADLINMISNSPEVSGLLSRYGTDFDWDPAVNHCVILSNGEDGCMIFEPKAPRHWECTTVFGETCRGKKAVDLGREIKDYMFPRFADLVFGVIPNDMRRAQWFYRQMGGKPVESIESGDRVYFAREGETLFALNGAE